MTHLVAIDGGWSLWTWTCLRATGFPARLVLELAGADAGAALRRLAADERFRQAVLWQNPRAVENALDALVRTPEGAHDSRTRQKERTVASYLQRYCVKNDTIGFFGPVGWARLSDSTVACVQRPGRALLASQTVYYEYWAIDALAAKLAGNPAIRRFIAPRVLPRFRVDGTTLHYPIGKQSELADEQAAVLALCDGVRTPRAIADELAWDEADVLVCLGELAEAGVVAWTLEIPTATFRPERELAALLARIDDPELRGHCEATLAELDAARAQVAATRSADELAAALAALAATFRAATDVASDREHGKTYAGRTPIYLDARRDLELELGRPFLERLGPPLALLLHSARWYTYEIARRYRDTLTALYRSLVAGALDFQQFWQAVPPLFPGGAAPGSIVGDVRAELQRRWSDVLAIAADERSVFRRASELLPAVERVFAAPGPGWPAARHHSPDILIAADGPDELARGDYQIVLGELHTGFNTVTGPVFAKEHPHPEHLIAARDADLDHACIAPVWSKAISRADYYSQSTRDFDLEVGDRRSARPRERVVTPGELVVEERAGALTVATRDGRARWDIIAFLEHHLIAESYAHFSPLAGAQHTPRVTIDDLVIARETWRIAAPFAWARIAEASARLAGARRWAHELGLPRFVFVKTVEEMKPVYVDFDSTVFVEMLANKLRDASAAAVSEMLPNVEQTWVIDREGARYCGELRIAAVDPQRWRAL